MRQQNQQKAGFSLVELSIVLVILGLLTGGILGGQSLIRAAELRGISADFGKYTVALRSFQDRYFQLPGDMTNAGLFWTDFGGSCPSPYNASLPRRTCNGDGNGRIGDVDNFEIYRFWQHLTNAGLIEGQYAGVVGTTVNGGTNVQFGINVPGSRIATAGYTVRYISQPCGGGGSSYLGLCNGTNVIFFGSIDAHLTRGPVLKPDEAWSIDQKVDDGRPGFGGLQVPSPNSSFQPNCATSNVQATAEYNVQSTTNACGLLFTFMR